MAVRIPRRHPNKALTDLTVRNKKKPGRYADRNGLYLIVDPSGADRWVLRIVVQGKRRDIGLGGVNGKSLKDARQDALNIRAVARSGGNPIFERRKQNQLVPRFEEKATKVHAERMPTWKNPKHIRR